MAALYQRIPNILLYNYSLSQKMLRGQLERDVVARNIDFE